MTSPVPVDPIVASTTVILMKSNGRAPNPSNLGTATGFFFRKRGSLYLITNRHVVIDEELNHFPDELVIRVHTRLRSMLNNRDIHIPLYLNGNQAWLEHPQDNNVDVVAICINNFVNDADVINAWSDQYFFQEDELVNYGDSVLVMDYPRGFYDRMHNLPIGRSGTVASQFKSHFEGNKYFLVDAVLHPGTSGSTVFFPTRSTRTTTQGYTSGSFPPVLLGINSGAYEPLELNTVWYADLIDTIIPDRN